MIITPYGGLRQIGSNMIHVQTKNQSFVIDCGILFPYEDFFGINYLIPNFTKMPKPDFLFVTHAHEDHIGAIPHFVEQFPETPIIASPFAKRLIEDKLSFASLHAQFLDFDNTRFELEDIFLDYISVNHSIPETYGLLLRDKKKINALFYVSDFKVDHHCPYEKPFEFDRLKELTKDYKNKILMADSTNILSAREKTLGEGDLVADFDEIMQQPNQRIFVTTFSSNAYRLQTILDSSLKAKRNVISYGRSIQRYSAIAEETRNLKEWSKKTTDISSYQESKKKITVIVSGCQGDFKSTLRRIAFGQDSRFQPEKGDLFVFSSKAIPGNEKRLSLLYNELSERGAQIITEKDKCIHASGHAGKEDLKELFNEFSPNVFIPIHGESLFLERHAEFIKKQNKDVQTFLLYNHQSFDSSKLKIKAASLTEEESLPLIITGKRRRLEKDHIRERRKIAEGGLCVVSFSIEKLSPIVVDFQGLTFENEVDKDHFQDKIHHLVQKEVSKSSNQYDSLPETIRIIVRKNLAAYFGFKPVVSVYIV